jgi:hypothetical protein
LTAKAPGEPRADGPIQLAGPLRKLGVLAGSPAVYELPVGDAVLALNPLLGARLRLRFTGVIRCVACGRSTRRSFNQGHCYPCFRSLAACDRCIVQPELCHHHLGTCREPDWGESYCFRPHLVYLANTSGLKVGVTRATQAPTRWLDQGAAAALPVLGIPTRRQAGLVEAILREAVSDRTDWRRMLRGEPPPVDLPARARELVGAAASRIEEAAGIGAPASGWDAAAVREFRYPVLRYPERVRALRLDAGDPVEGVLEGVKGQYLLLDVGVLNVRRHAGYEIVVEVLDHSVVASAT